MDKISVVICDDIAEIRNYFVKTIEKTDDMCVVGVAKSGKEVIQIVREKKPDIVLLDLQMETPKSGIDATRIICSENPNTKVLILTIHDNDDLICESYIAGAVAYLLKDSDENTILDNIHNAYENDNFIGPYLAKKIKNRIIESRKMDMSIIFLINKISSLTKNENNIIKYLCAGYKRREICDKMFISEDTVKMHIRHLLKKLEFNNCKEMIEFFKDVGLYRFFDL